MPATSQQQQHHVKIETSVTRLDRSGERITKTIRLRTPGQEFHPLQHQTPSRNSKKPHSPERASMPLRPNFGAAHHTYTSPEVEKRYGRELGSPGAAGDSCSSDDTIKKLQRRT